MFTGLETAELTKYAANAFLAMKVTFINEMADLCEKVGADVHDVARGIGLDGRIGRKFLHPGPGFGGSCFPKDTLALMRIAQDAGAPRRLVEAVGRRQRRAQVGDGGAHRSRPAAAACAARRIAVLGLTFKPETDDMREAPAIPIVWRLAEDGADGARLRPGRHGAGASAAAARACSIAATRSMPPPAPMRWSSSPNGTSSARSRRRGCARRCAGGVIVDLRNIFDPAAMREAGFAYHGIGRAAP